SLRPDRGLSVDLRDSAALAHIGGPFERQAHSIDIRRITSPYTPGRFNVPNVGLFIWRLRAYPVTRTNAYCVEDVSPSCFTFSVLGNDSQLYTNPQAGHRATDELNFAAPISRHAMRMHLADYYGENQSFAIWTIEGRGVLDPESRREVAARARRDPL